MNVVEKSIPEKTKSILIPIKTINSNININYALHSNFFDPTKSSPPNEFMKKLNKRMESYSSLGIKNNNCVNA